MNHLHRGDTIVFATHNAGKLRELDELLAPFRNDRGVGRPHWVCPSRKRPG